ncbi:YidC/Oxa1 family membrane protein insertase [Thermohalobacter berrensis]|uniref:Sporulation protein n=1 Tax=Thermohalobacter berrensis TaxID=99594 RepID=A0A419T1E3_9FIRM|nr:YidC/Oxa1 family membrane protein insertase [Thermohalobacter berrensis]RKD31374.1 sporulation protein [Thermohalobacter berrensis]
MIDLFARPLGALVELIYNFVKGIGFDAKLISAYAISIIISTIILKFILLPLTLKQTRSMKKMQELQPKIKELQKKYKNDQQTLNTKMMELYKENNVNPFGGCFPILIQFPIIIGFFNVLRQPVKYIFGSEAVYEAINKSFFWISNLKDPDQWALPVIAAVTTYLQSKLMNTSGGNPQAEATQRTMTLVFPVMIFVFSRSFPAGLALYWVVSNIFQIVQQLIINRSVAQVKEESN